MALKKVWVVQTRAHGFGYDVETEVFARLSDKDGRKGARTRAAGILVEEIEREEGLDRGSLKIFKKIADALSQEKIQRALKHWERYLERGCGGPGEADENTRHIALFSREVQ